VAELSELPFKTRLFLKTYPWRRIEPVPWTPMRKPLRDAKIAIVSTAGLVTPEQTPFDMDVRGGDWSYREIPDGADVRTLVDAHRSESYDHAAIHADPNLGMPIDRLRELAAIGTIFSANCRHFSLMGSLTAPGKMCTHSAPEVARKLVEDEVDAVLLVPI
jgi:D-proline reductase (dithiol) PrdB